MSAYLSQSTWSDLAPLKALSAPQIEYLIAQVAAVLTHRTAAKSNLNLQSIASDLEGEGVEWSEKKLQRVTDALKLLSVNYFRAHKVDAAQAKESLQSDIESKSALTKQSVVEALVNALAFEASVQSGFASVFEVMRLQQLVDF